MTARGAPALAANTVLPETAGMAPVVNALSNVEPRAGAAGSALKRAWVEVVSDTETGKMLSSREITSRALKATLASRSCPLVALAGAAPLAGVDSAAPE